MAEKVQTRYLIVNADDFGLTAGVNRGIIEAHERGIVTSASLMVRHQAGADAAHYARTHPKLSIGLHFETGEWRHGAGGWEVVRQIVDTGDWAAVRREFERQLAEFERLLGQWPTHLDSHQHVHRKEPALSILLEAARRLRIPLRGCSSTVRYCGDFYGQTSEGAPFPEGLWFSRLERLIEALPPGWTELGCHPGYADELDSKYLREREEELLILCRAQAREALARNRVHLRSFREIVPEGG